MTLDCVTDPKKFISYLKNSGRLNLELSPERIIFIFSQPLIEQCKVKYKLTKEPGFDAGDLYLIDGDKSIGIFYCNGIGSPVSVINMEELIAFGAKKFIVIGTAGSLQHSFVIGERMICNEAIKDEGTSAHYISNQFSVKPTYTLHNDFMIFAKKNNIELREGASWTTDAPYRETTKKIQELQQRGVLSVEMEISSLFTLAKFRNVDIIALFTVSDQLADFKWVPGFFSEDVMKSLLLSVKNAISFMSQPHTDSRI